MVPTMPNGNGGEHLMGLPLREAREVFEREYLRRADQPLRRQYFAHRRIRRHGALGAAPQAEGAGHRVARESRARTGARHVAHRLRERPLSCRTRDAAVHVEDRGYQFADGVYEVCEVRGGRLVDERRHMDAAASARSASCASRMPMSRGALGVVLRETVRAQPRARRHRLSAGHARRGAARPRLSAAPARRRASSSPRAALDRRRERAGAPPRASPVITVPDNRWERVDIKSIGAAAQRARQAGGARAGRREAWFVDAKGFVTEGSSTNAWIVTRDGTRGHARRPTTASCAASPARSCSRSSPRTG